MYFVLCVNVKDCLKRLLISPSEAAGLAGNTESWSGTENCKGKMERNFLEQVDC